MLQSQDAAGVSLAMTAGQDGDLGLRAGVQR